MRMLLVSIGLLVAMHCAARTESLAEFDREAGWRPLPSYLSNPAQDFAIELLDGVVRLVVGEPGKGMKFELPLRAFDADRYAYLVMRYRAEALGPGYAIWAMAGKPGGLEVLNTAELDEDGQWHEIAVDLAARGATGSVTAVLTEVQATDRPAWIEIDYLRAAEDPPAGVKIVPEGPSALPPDRVIRGRELELVHHRDWLAVPADVYGARVEGEALHLWAEGTDKGMKWSAPLLPPLDLKGYRWAAVRYRARGLAPWGDYFIWLGSGGGGLPQAWTTVIPLAELRDDDEWHTAVVPVRGEFTAVDIAVQVSSRAGRGDIWFDQVTFSARRPAIAPEDVLPVVQGWQGSRLRSGSFRPINLSRWATASLDGLAGDLGLSRWLGPGRVTVRGIPFDLLPGPQNGIATGADIKQTTVVPIGEEGSELYLLMAALLPNMAYSGVLGQAPLRSFSNPERFVIEVHYEDGIVDEVVPVCLSSSTNQIVAGPEVYCIPALRGQRVKALGLRNRMSEAVFAVAAVTMNTGKGLVEPPSVQGLPPYAPAKPDPLSARKPSITPTRSGYVVETGALRLELATDRGITLRSLRGGGVETASGDLFELSVGEKKTSSGLVSVGPVAVERGAEGLLLRVPFDAGEAGVPVRGEFICEPAPAGEIKLSLNLTYAGEKPEMVAVRFPLIRSLRIGGAEDTWYLWACKGGIISSRPASFARWYGGEYPLQVCDAFNPKLGRGLALLTYDLDDLYKQWQMQKTHEGIDWSIEYWRREFQPGEKIPIAQTALRAHTGDWRAALGIYRAWARSWYRPQVPRKKWFRECFNYRQHWAWTELYDFVSGTWRMDEIIQADRDFFGCLDYLHIFDFGDSRVYGRVGDYSHYDELGGLEKMAAAIARAKELGVPVGLYIEGYLCDERAAWGKENVLANNMRDQEGKSMIYGGEGSEHVMCPAALGWREHLAGVYRRVAGELQPSGMYIDQYGFIGPWYACWSREHGHPVPWPPISGERDTLKAIRAAVPEQIATLTEETPNDLNSQYQDGALGYSVAFNDPVLAPHRIDLFRFVFPDFKVFQLVSYNPFVEGGWDLLKYPFFNADGYWLHNRVPDEFSEDARDFLRKAFAILHEHRDAFCGEDVEPLVPTLEPTVYANRFAAPGKTVWTLFNAGFSTFRGEVLCVAHRKGARYVDAFTGKPLAARIHGQWAFLPLVLGPQGVGCVVAEYTQR